MNMLFPDLVPMYLAVTSVDPSSDPMVLLLLGECFRMKKATGVKLFVTEEAP